MQNNIFNIKQLTKTYQMGQAQVHALRGVSLDIPKGSVTVLLGPSGSGKSTFLNILGGLDRGTSGDVSFQNQNLSHMDDEGLTHYRRHHVGFVFQFYNLMPSLTALENVQLVSDIADNPMDDRAALELVNLDKRADHFPSQMSGGEQQRVAIARALVKQPDVLLCDEPTGALDRETGILVLDALMRINEEIGTTILIVTHNAATAGLGHRVIHFADGDVRDVVENKTRIKAQDIHW